MANETDSILPDGRQEDNSDEISIIDLLLVIAAGKKLIITLTFICGIAAGVIAFIVPEIFTATATILTPKQQSSSAALLSQLGGLASLTGQSIGIKNPAEVYIGIMESRTVADELIKQFELQKVYEKENPADVRKKLGTVSDFKLSDSGMIHVSVKDREPQRAADMANAYVELLKNRNNELALTEASQRRMFFEKQWEEARNRLAEAEWELKSLQEREGVLKIDSQMEAVIQSIVRLEAEITTAEAELARLKTGAAKQNPKVRQQEAVIMGLRARLQELRTQNAGRNQNDPLLPTSMMPEAGLKYARKFREVRYYEALYELIARQYEAARIDEANESPLIQVVDEAVPPERRSAPRRKLYVLAGLMFGGMAGVFIVFLRHAASDPSQANKVAELRNLLKFGL